jgi:hypothetical protein
VILGEGEIIAAASFPEPAAPLTFLGGCLLPAEEEDASLISQDIQKQASAGMSMPHLGDGIVSR